VIQRDASDVTPVRTPAVAGVRTRLEWNGGRMGVFEIVVEPNARRRRRQPLSGKKRAAALFRMWHDLAEMIREAELIGDRELVHFLSVTQLLVAEKAVGLTGTAAFEAVDTSRPN
jgi:hypothetical protein